MSATWACLFTQRTQRGWQSVVSMATKVHFCIPKRKFLEVDQVSEARGNTQVIYFSISLCRNPSKTMAKKKRSSTTSSPNINNGTLSTNSPNSVVPNKPKALNTKSLVLVL